MATIVFPALDPENPPIQNQFAEEIIAESDRGAALLAASGLDEQLLGILQAFLVDGKAAKELLGVVNKGSAAVGSFSARNKLAFSLGLINQQEYIDCNIVRSIRNDFAHKFEMKFSFKQELVAQRVKGFQLLSQEERERHKNDPREIFLHGVAALYTRWSTRHFYMDDIRMQKREWDKIGMFPMILEEPKLASEATPPQA